MTEEMWLIAVVRVFGSLPVLRWPFFGALLALLVDLSDLFMMDLINLGGVNDYQGFDKYLDQVYLLTFLIVALRWRGPARDIAIALYAYRIAGFIVFETTHSRDLILLFPNLFEFWFLLVAAYAWATSRGPTTEPSGSMPRPSGRGTAISPMPQPSGWGTATNPMPQPSGRGAVAPYPALPFADLRFRALLAGLFALKLFQEYALHYARWLDGFTAVDAVRAVWHWLLPFA